MEKTLGAKAMWEKHWGQRNCGQWLGDIEVCGGIESGGKDIGGKTNHEQETLQAKILRAIGNLVQRTLRTNHILSKEHYGQRYN